MIRLHAFHRLIAVALAAIFALATLAPLAEAGEGRGKHRRYKGRGYQRTRVVERIYVPERRYYSRRESNAGPLIAGLIGGFILGATTTRAAAKERYVYWDPYCERGYTSFDDCRAHWGCHDGPKVLYKVESRSGRCVGAFRHASDGWHEWDGNPAGWGDDHYGHGWYKGSRYGSHDRHGSHDRGCNYEGGRHHGDCDD